MELTDAGRELYDAVKLGLGHIRQAAGRIGGRNGPDTLSVGCTYGFAHLWLMPRFSALQKLVPKQELRMVTADTRTLFDLGEVNFALRFGVGAWPDGASERLFGEQLFPVCSPEFAERYFGGCTGVDAAALASMPLIHERPEDHGWLTWRQWMAHHAIEYAPPANTYYYDSYALTMQAASEGLGVALGWYHFVEPMLTSGQLVELEGLRVRTGNGYYLAFRPDQPQAQTMANWFRTMAAAQEAAAR